MIERPRTAARIVRLRTLGGVEARRYARHPLFLLGVAALVVTMIIGLDDLDASVGDDTAVPAFFLGVLGVFVGYQLTRSLLGPGDAVDAAPADRVTRTAALCLACLVPGAVALAWVAAVYVSMSVWPIPDSVAITTGELAAMLGAAVVYAVGGPLVGVMVGRWTQFPGAGLVASVLLVVWSVLGGFGNAMSASRLANLVHVNAPFTGWVTSDGAAPEPLWVTGGSPGWYLAYITVLCGLAATVAMLRGASGAQRARLVCVLAFLAVLAVGCLTLAASADPTRIPL
jgi:hypothetical protein